jgi:hypothetical protein
MFGIIMFIMCAFLISGQDKYSVRILSRQNRDLTPRLQCKRDLGFPIQIRWGQTAEIM